MKQIESTLPILVYEKRQFQCTIANSLMATIEVLCFAEDKYAAQATINKNNKKISTAALKDTYSDTIDGALQKIIMLIEEEIKDDEFVKKTVARMK